MRRRGPLDARGRRGASLRGADRLGHVGLRRRARRLRRPRRARRGRRQVPGRVRLGRQPGAARRRAVGSTWSTRSGSQGPGVAAWRERRPARRCARAARPSSRRSGAGRSRSSPRPPRRSRGADVAAVEVNASCPNLDDGSAMFAHSARATADGGRGVPRVRACRCGRSSARTPRTWSRSPRRPWTRARRRSCWSTPCSAWSSTSSAGARALGAVGGGVSGPGILPVALRAVFDVPRGAAGDADRRRRRGGERRGRRRHA